MWLINGSQAYDSIAVCAPRRRPRNHRANWGEWEKALLMAWGAEMPMPSAAFYRRKAARARQVAQGVTTRAMKAKLLEDAVITIGLLRRPIARRKVLQPSRRER